MIKAGYKRHVAGAIEPAASTGGMFMPPIMGAGVFIMAEMIRVPYTEIMVVALVPAILYFFSVGAIAHFEAARENIPVLPRSERENPWQILRQGWHFMIPRSEEHTSELQSLMRISYAVFCLKKNTTKHTQVHKE